MELNDSILKIKGIGPKNEKLFHKLDIGTVGELLHFYPREYDTFGSIVPIAQVREGDTVVIYVSPVVSPRITKVRHLQIINTPFRDASGEISVVWFNMQFLMRQIKLGTHYILRGKVTRKNGLLTLQQPKILTQEQYQKNLGKLLPVYPLTAGLTNYMVTKAMQNALTDVDSLKEYLPAEIRKRCDLILYKTAIRTIHFPKSMDEYIAARRRLVFDEFFLFALAIHQMKTERHQKKTQNVFHPGEKVETLLKKLPYELTEGQKRALEDIEKDLASGYVMNRLIQGDVGSGKTIVSILALLLCVKNGHQGAIMVPTEVLAKQHYDSFLETLGDLGVRICLLTGSMTAAQKRKAYASIETGDVDIVIGTHALIQDKVHFANLALVVTDEQHRFGVRQREAISKKGEEPHMLVMSATPIPRTLAIILYGDLDVSVIDVMPSNRLPIKNCVVGTNYRPQSYQFIQKQVSMGHQAYIICPMVEESENMEVENVTDYTENLMRIMPPSVRIDMLHGKMKAAQKQEIMERFQNHETDVLVSTTVIEVGINVPNATVMMIENAERFGLAQLHQLRGRVGRGSAQSYCIFMAGKASKEVMERLDVVGNSNDGFYVAQQDMKLRGPGDLFGIRQSGELDFKLADIYQDAKLLTTANEEASKMTREDVLSMCKKYEPLRQRLEGYCGEIFL